MVDVEKRATSAIEQLLSVCPHLVSYIDSNDKTPLTDGFVIVYSGLSRRNEDITGRLDVQVKGRTIGTRAAPTTYSISRTELTAIRKHGTVLLFVVFVRADGTYVGSPKYAVLSPFAIDMLLNRTRRKQRSAAVVLKDLPESPPEIESIVGIGVLSQRQRLHDDVTGSVLEDGASITIHSAKQFSLDEPMTFSPEHGDFVVEVKTTRGIVLPLSGEVQLVPGSYLERQTDMVVRCGAVEYRNTTVRQVDAKSHEVKLSNGITMRLAFEDERVQTSSFNLTFVDNLADRVKDIDFFLASRHLTRSRSTATNTGSILRRSRM